MTCPLVISCDVVDFEYSAPCDNINDPRDSTGNNEEIRSNISREVVEDHSRYETEIALKKKSDLDMRGYIRGKGECISGRGW